MHALIHFLAAVLVLPYLALASLLLLIGEAARTKGLFSLLNVALEHAIWILGWGIYVMPLLWLLLAVSGAISRLKKTGALVLGLVATGSLVTIVSLQPSHMELSQVLFLAPCLGIIAVSIWLYLQASTGCEPR